MKELYELRDIYMEELRGLAKKHEMSMGSLDVIHKLTATIKNIDKIMMMDGGYSREGGSYDNGYSGRHYVRGHYSRDGYSRDNSYGRYSQRGDIGGELRELMDRTEDERTRQLFRRLLDELENS